MNQIYMASYSIKTLALKVLNLNQACFLDDNIKVVMSSQFQPCCLINIFKNGRLIAKTEVELDAITFSYISDLNEVDVQAYISKLELIESNFLLTVNQSCSCINTVTSKDITNVEPIGFILNLT